MTREPDATPDDVEGGGAAAEGIWCLNGLAEAHPEIDPRAMRFTVLHNWVMELPDFDDDPNHSGEKILEAIQMAWIDEVS